MQKITEAQKIELTALIDGAMAALISQGRPSVDKEKDENGTYNCYYRENGDANCEVRCFVGHLILDQHYTYNCEMKAVTADPVKKALMLSGIDLDLCTNPLDSTSSVLFMLGEAQDIHDKASDGITWEAITHKLEDWREDWAEKGLLLPK